MQRQQFFLFPLAGCGSTFPPAQSVFNCGIDFVVLYPKPKKTTIKSGRERKSSVAAVAVDAAAVAAVVNSSDCCCCGFCCCLFYLSQLLLVDFGLIPNYCKTN